MDRGHSRVGCEERPRVHTQRGHLLMRFVGRINLLLLERATLPSAQRNKTRIITKKRKGKERERWSGRMKQAWLLLSAGLLCRANRSCWPGIQSARVCVLWGGASMCVSERGVNNASQMHVFDLFPPREERFQPQVASGLWVP